MIWQVNLENQRLVIKIISALIRIGELPTIQEPILGYEIIIAQTEDEPFVVVSKQAVDRDDANTFPFLVEKAGVLGAAVVDSEAVEL